MAVFAFWFVKIRTPKPDWQQGTYVDLNGKEQKLEPGKYVLVSYFQTWCADCIRELPHIQSLQQKIGKEMLSVYLISDEELPKLKRFQNRFKVDLPIFQTQVALKLQGVFSYPTTYLISPEGKILLVKKEGYDWSQVSVIQLFQ
jgi:thiol-disulfide isomerase/thioredoxin